MNPVEAHYNRFAEREWERLNRHRTEFAVTCRVLREFLPAPPGQILDVGGGPGRYTLYLARLGYRPILLDLSRKSLDLALERAIDAGIYIEPPIHGDATSLPEDFTGIFDAVLLMGPLYHLLEEAERMMSVREAFRVMRPGGIVFAAFITRFAPLRDLAIHSPEWVLDNPDRLQQLLEAGVNPAHETSSFPDSYFIHPDGIIPLMESGGFKTETLQSCEGLVAGHEEAINSLEGELWEAWVELNYRVGREPCLFGAADHLLYVGTKPLPLLHEDTL